MSAPAGRSSPRTSRLAQAAALLALCLGPVGLVLCLVALVHLYRHPHLRGRDLAFGGIALSVGWLLVAALTVPGFLKFQARARQSGCQSTLLQLRQAQRERGQYTERVSQLGVQRPRKQRYVYFLSAGAPVAEGPEANLLPAEYASASPEALAGALRAAGVQPGPSGSSWRMACAGDIDSDDTLDIWVLEGPEGRPVNVVDDVAQ